MTSGDNLDDGVGPELDCSGCNDGGRMPVGAKCPNCSSGVMGLSGRCTTCGWYQQPVAVTGPPCDRPETIRRLEHIQAFAATLREHATTPSAKAFALRIEHLADLSHPLELDPPEFQRRCQVIFKDTEE